MLGQFQDTRLVHGDKIDEGITIVVATIDVDDIESKLAAGMRHGADTIASFALIFGKNLRRSAMGEGDEEWDETMTIRGSG